MKTIRIGSGAGYAGDRLEPSLELIEKGNLDYISYECLAERTIAIGQQAKLKDPAKGYNGLLEHRMEKAAALLHESDMSIAEIGRLVGYESQSKFTAAFKESYGCLPKEYRKKV